MDKLQEARSIINAVDKEIAALFSRRMEAAKMVAEYKGERGLPIFDAEREAQLIAHNSRYIEDDDIRSYYVNFLQNLMDLSKQYQHRILDGLRVAYSGVEGAFAHIAVTRIFPDSTPISYRDFPSAYESVVKGECDCAVLPIENSFAGEVGQVSDLMFEGSLFVNGIYSLPITHNLLGVKGASLSDIRRVVSHPQALDQCAGYIHDHNFEQVQSANTARAAQSVAEAGDIHTAAIASTETAALYGLEILDHDIHESATNTTRFAVFSRVENKATVGTSKSNFLLLFTVNDEAGALAKAINIIGKYGFNMHVLRSRPMKEPAWQYYFYVEAEGDETSLEGQRMLMELSLHCSMLKVVGHYAVEKNLAERELETK
ncbi:MAG: bifunctional chorismate mutase/prephenate dehydratase [Clostridiales bacterium]|nr:bifunctional chorismate mutase/prephenate dehydratase [Clostridiales bacterium]